MKRINTPSFFYKRKLQSSFGPSFSCFTKTHAFTRQIDDKIKVSACASNPSFRSTIDLAKARKEQAALSEIIRSLGVTIHNLPSDGYPDSVFIEDVAIIIDGTALITHPGTESRIGEANSVRQYLTDFKDKESGESLRVIDLPEGNVDGGDVLFTGK